MTKMKKIAIAIMAGSGIAMAITVFSIPLITKILISVFTASGFAGYKLYEKS